MGHEMILRCSGSYCWNTEIPLVLDTEEFEALCAAAEKETQEEEKLRLYLQAMELYQGDVVSRCSVSQMVVMLPQANYENSCAVCQRIIKAFQRQYPPFSGGYSLQCAAPGAYGILNLSHNQIRSA